MPEYNSGTKKKSLVKINYHCKGKTQKLDLVLGKKMRVAERMQFQGKEMIEPQGHDLIRVLEPSSHTFSTLFFPIFLPGASPILLKTLWDLPNIENFQNGLTKIQKETIRIICSTSLIIQVTWNKNSKMLWKCFKQ